MNKIIHYCWFGRGEKSDLILSCIESWKKFCPDFEIREWNEDNFDVTKYRYTKEAYEAGKWAFVSDVCRFEVLALYGGVYMDTDVELRAPIDDLSDSFVGFENKRSVNSGLIRAACPGDPICLLMLASYRADRFTYENGAENVNTVCHRETAIFREHGLKLDGKEQTVMGTTVYPPEVFCPLSFETGKLKITEKTRSIHHYGASWATEEQLYAQALRRRLRHILPGKFGAKCAFALTLIRFRGFRGMLAYKKNQRENNEK